MADDVIVDRMTGRRSCPECGRMYHIAYNPPKIQNKCDECGAELIQRKDDNEETVLNRLKVYHETTAPVIDYYRNRGILMTVSGVGDIEEIFNKVASALEGIN